MAYEQPSMLVGFYPADLDLSSAQFCGVVVVAAAHTQGAGTGGAAIQLPAANTNPIIGIVQNNPAVGEAGTVMSAGISKAIASGPIAINDLLQCDANGKFLKAVSGKYVVAQALESAVAGDIFTVFLKNHGLVA